MNQPELAEFNIEITASDATDEELDRMTRQLLSELRETDVESAELAKAGEVPQGAKSADAVNMGSIVVSALPAILPAIVTLVQAWAGRGQGRAIKFKGKLGGAEIEFEGSPEELQRLLALLEAKEKVRAGERVESQDTTGEVRSTPIEPGSSLNIFISYRRADSADVTGRIYDRLIGYFGKPAIFKDVDSIPLGVDFKEHLKEAVARCNIFLAVIGDQWMGPPGSRQESRLDDPQDFVRIEIESALDQNIRVIPLLIRGATMPPVEKLPPSLQKLIYRNALAVRPDPDFHRDMDRLIAAILEMQHHQS